MAEGVTRQTASESPTYREPIVVVLEAHPPAVRAAIEAEALPEMECRMATTTDSDGIRTLAADCDGRLGTLLA
jgi:hypothetical protein